jgi:hypothetical protein
LENRTYAWLRTKIINEYKLEQRKFEEAENCRWKSSDNHQPEYEKLLKLENGKVLQIIKYFGYMSGQTEVRIDDKFPLDGFYKEESVPVCYEISKGRIKMEYYLESYPQKNGLELIVAGSRISGIRKGCPAWVNDSPAPSGRYTRGFFHTKINIKDGRVV